MKRQVLKYDLCFGATKVIPLFHDDQVLRVAMQDGTPRIWINVQIGLPAHFVRTDRHFSIVATGREHNLTDYIGTMDDDPHVWHVFEGTLR